MHVKTLLVCGLLAATAAGCGDSDDKDATPAATTAAADLSAPKAGYVASVNRLCAELIPKVLDAQGGGHPVSLSIEDFTAERPKLRALHKAFDAKVDALGIAAAEQPAAGAFDAFRRESDKSDEQLAVAAESGKQETFDAAVEANDRKYESSSIVKDLEAAGIHCPAR